jgi:hypothetical protein
VHRVIAPLALVILVAAGCGSSGTAAPAPPTRASTSTLSATTSSTNPCPLPTARPASTRLRLHLRRTPTAAAPLRATVVGDSIAQTLAPSIAVGFDQLTARTGVPHAQVQSAALPGFGFGSALPGIVHGKPDPGFPAFRDWQGLLDRAVTKYDPDVVIALVGSWDMVPRRVDGTYLDPTSCRWSSWYRPLVEEAGQHLTARGAVIIWLSFPCTVQRENRLHFALNRVFHAFATAHRESVAYLDLDAFVCPHGKVLADMRAPDGSVHRVRGGDRTHFEFYGAPPVLGPYFAAQLQRLLVRS